MTIELRNESKNVFVDISSEMYREYVYQNGTVVIEGPQWLSVSNSGGHRILDNQGVSHYIPPGWIHLFWKVPDDKPHFVK